MGQRNEWESEHLGQFEWTNDCYRLGFHLMPPQGWMNDPNGLCEWKGRYHVFFQYSPEDAQGGDKLWGHYSTGDILHWKWHGAALRPDEEFDRDGVYSGSGLADEGELKLYYTGNVKLPGNYDYIYNGREANTVLVSTADGEHFSAKHCVMRNSDYPSSYSCHIRDPKVWRKKDAYYMVQGGRRKGESPGADQGTVLLFSSDDGYHWQFIQETSTLSPFGFMWECPDYFTLEQGEKGGQEIEILSVSPQGVQAEEYRFQNVYQSGYFSGKNLLNLREENSEACLRQENFVEWDAGFDFYAPQTFCDQKGRRILIGWAGIPDAEYDNQPTVDRGWQHSLTIPRNLQYRNGKIIQTPLEELKKLRRNGQTIRENQELEFCTGAMWDMEVEGISSEDFLFEIEQKQSGFRFCWKSGVFSVEFFGDHGVEIGRGRTRRQGLLSELTDVRILMDTSLVEIYLNQGERVLTSRYYLQEGNYRCRIQGVSEKKTLWQMKCFTIE